MSDSAGSRADGELVWCAACGGEGAAGEAGHERCAQALVLDTPRFCTRCGRRLDVQVYPLSVSATCRRCDGVHPKDRGAVQDPA